MAAGDINDPLSQIPGIALADDSTDPTDQGAGYALLKFKSGQLIWLPNGGALTYALDTLTPGQVHGIAEKASPVAADVLLLEDSAASWAKKRVPWSALPGSGGVSAPVDWSGTITLTQSGAVTHTVSEAYYQLLGKLCVVYVKLLITGAGTGNNAIVVGGLPAPAQPPDTSGLQGIGAFVYSDLGTAYYTGSVGMPTVSTFGFYCHNLGGSLGQTPDFACANTDTLGFTAHYRMA